MKRIAKIIDREPSIPELGYLVLYEEGAVVWNGAIGVRFSFERIGGALAKLVKQHKRFAVVDALKFIKIAAALEKAAQSVILDEKSSQLRIGMAGKKGTIDVPIVRDIPDELPHLQVPWHILGEEDVDRVPLDTVWFDALDLITGEGAHLWGDVIGVYDAEDWCASFDYGVLLYHNKKGHRKKADTGLDTAVFAPMPLLDVGLKGMSEAIIADDHLFITGTGVTYYTSFNLQPFTLQSMLGMRDKAEKAKAYAVKLDYTSGLWKRAKIFSELAVEMIISGGSMVLKGDSWHERIGTTDAPDKEFITRVSLLERWTLGTMQHSIRVTNDEEWYLLGTTRKGSEFIGHLTSIGDPITAELDPEAEAFSEVDVGDEEDFGPLLG